MRRDLGYTLLNRYMDHKGVLLVEPKKPPLSNPYRRSLTVSLIYIVTLYNRNTDFKTL